MDFRFAKLKRLLFLAGMAATASCAQAQSTGQSILFSAPDNGNAASNVPSLSAPSPLASALQDAMQPSDFNFGVMPARNANPLAPQSTAASPDDFQRLQKLTDERNNWALLTPAESLDIPTQEKIMGIPERDAAGQEKSLTVVERYYKRQNQSQTGRTNDFQDDTASRWNFQGDQDDTRLNADSFKPANGGFEKPAQNADSFFNNNTRDNRAVAGQKADSGWGDFFAAPARPTPSATAASLEQQAEMERFRQLLEPPPQPVPTARPAPGGTGFSSPQTEPDSFFGQSSAKKSIGGSFTPLASGVGGLPAVPGQNNARPATVTPSWAPQPPPWMSSTPQSGVISQWNF